jgi:uncharacterized RDD family membrane protein YckC
MRVAAPEAPDSPRYAGLWIRVFANVLDVACLGVGYLYIAIDPRNQGWHDKIVRTLVVRRGSAT